MTARNGHPERVVVTGLGVASSLGVEVGPLWEAVVNGRSGIGPIRQYDAGGFPVQIASEVDIAALPADGDDPVADVNRALRFGLWAGRQAWDDAGLARAGFDPERVGVCTGSGGFPPIEARFVEPRTAPAPGERWSSSWLLALLRERPDLLARRQLSAISERLAGRFDLRGPSLTVQGACASGTQAVGEAFHMVRSGRADAMLAGGADSMLSAFCLAGFTLLGALSTHREPETASRPFDRTRNGFVMGEGAAMAVLESLPHARARGAKIYAEAIGYGSSSDGYRFTDVHPEGSGAVRAMRRALADAAIQPEDVGYINAHGTSTPQNDRVETRAVKEAFGDHSRRLPVSSTKSHLGHLICAAGAIEFLLTALTLASGIAPGTLNLHRRDVECDLDYVPLEARRIDCRVALSNSFGFGGQNATLALRRWEE